MAVWLDFEHPRLNFEPLQAGQRGHKGSYRGPKMARNGSKMMFPKMGWESIGNIFGPIWKHFEAFLTMFEPANGANYNGNGPLWDQKRVKNGSKMTLFKIGWEPIGNILGPILKHFEAFWTILEPANSPNCNGNGPFWHQKRAQNGSKMTLVRLDWEPSGSDWGPFWKHFEAFSSMFEPVNGPNYNGSGRFWHFGVMTLSLSSHCHL